MACNTGCSLNKTRWNRILAYVLKNILKAKEKRKVMVFGWCDCSYSAGAGNGTYPAMSRHRRGSRSGLLYWGRLVGHRPPHCRSGRSHRHHSRRRGWWECWCCWGKASHCPRWRWADSKQIVLVFGSHFSWWEWKLCCLGESKHITQDFWWTVQPNWCKGVGGWAK